MKSSRRKFLKLAGLSALGLGAAPALSTVARATEEAAPAGPDYKPTDEGLTAARWGMVIFTDQFEDQESFDNVIHACHSTHNVPRIPDREEEVKWLWTDTMHHAFPEQVNNYQSHEVEERKYLLLCNHCDSPPCVRVCPTKATFKREDGIVIMDFHRCIGCRFCLAACPFGARSFNFGNPRPYLDKEGGPANPEFPTRMRGVVEKCNFCAERLAKGIEPACVEASDGAIIFGDLDDPHSEVREALAHHYSIRRKPNLGTQPSVYYVIGG